MAEAICAYPRCDRQGVHQCMRCRQAFCLRHSEPIYSGVGARSPYRCTTCIKESRDEARQHTRRSKRGVLSALVVLVIGVITIIVGTALAPASDKVTLAALAGLIIAGIGAVSLTYSIFGG